MGNELSTFFEGGSSPRSSPRNSIRVSFDMSALEEGRFPILKIKTDEETSTELNPRSMVNICELVRKNSFTALDKTDVETLVLEGETADHVGDFPYLWDAEDVDALDHLFRFVAEKDFQLVTINEEFRRVLSIYVIRPKI